MYLTMFLCILLSAFLGIFLAHAVTSSMRVDEHHHLGRDVFKTQKITILYAVCALWMFVIWLVCGQVLLVASLVSCAVSLWFINPEFKLGLIRCMSKKFCWLDQASMLDLRRGIAELTTPEAVRNQRAALSEELRLKTSDLGSVVTELTSLQQDADQLEKHCQALKHYPDVQAHVRELLDITIVAARKAAIRQKQQTVVELTLAVGQLQHRLEELLKPVNSLSPEAVLRATEEVLRSARTATQSSESHTLSERKTNMSLTINNEQRPADQAVTLRRFKERFCRAGCPILDAWMESGVIWVQIDPSCSWQQAGMVPPEFEGLPTILTLFPQDI